MHIDKIKQLYKNFSIVPLKSIESKRPIWDNWTDHCKKRADFSKLENHKGIFGICGGFEGIEFIDIDNHLGNADELFKYIDDNFELLSKLPVTKTQSGGYHIYYKCDNPKESLKLAQKKYIPPEKDIFQKEIKLKDKEPTFKKYCKLPDGKERVLTNGYTIVTLIETRGKGGQVVFYDNFIQGNIDSVTKISDEQRDILFQICESQNEVAGKEEKTQTKQKGTDFKESPGDMYINDPWAIQETINLLLSNGWTTKNNITWWRPGKNFRQGPAANFQKVGLNKFYNFSPNGYPFPERESITMFGVRAILKHNGDFSACAKELAEHYGILKTKSSKPDLDISDTDEDEKLTAIQVKWLVLKKIIKEWGLKFRYNQLTNVIDYSKNNGKTYNDDCDLIYSDIVAEMEINRKIKSITKSKVSEMISSSIICFVYNPINHFFKSLPEWNKIDYFKELKKYIILDENEDIDFFFTMLKKHLIRSVACARLKEYENRFCFVMHGAEEIGKTKFLKWLMPENNLYYSEHIDPSNKDDVLALSKYLFINLDDLDELNRKEVGKIKSFISKGKITKRVSYGKHDRNFIRIANFWGSTNKKGILSDTGNTRWLIFKVLNFKWKEYIKNINPLQIWAQAVYEFKKDNDSGELTKEEKQKRDIRNNSDFLQITQERELLLRFFSAGNIAMTATDVKYLIETKMHPLRLNEYNLRRELHRQFGEPTNPMRADTIRGDENKQGRYYYLNTELYSHNLNEYVNEMTEPETVEDDLPF
jgi:predicted P-loop ATPase